MKDCKVLRGHASARQKVRGREGGREVEGRDILFYAVANFEVFGINYA